MIFEKVREIICEQLGVDAEKVDLTTSFEDDLGADSLDLFQIVMDIEDAFDIKIEETDGIQTVEDAIKYIEKEKSDN